MNLKKTPEKVLALVRAVSAGATLRQAADPDPTVSRRHAIVLQQSDGRFLLADLGSTNGTFVNGARVSSAVLADGDHVRFGDSAYRFLARGDG